MVTAQIAHGFFLGNFGNHLSIKISWNWLVNKLFTFFCQFDYTIWNLDVYELLEYTSNRISSDLQGFADGLALVSIVTAPRQTNGIQGYDADTLKEVTQKSLNNTNLWCKKSGLKLSHLKTHCVMFTKRRNWSFSRPHKVDGIEIEVQKSTKFLGIILDSKLSWNEHIKNVFKTPQES